MSLSTIKFLLNELFARITENIRENIQYVTSRIPQLNFTSTTLLETTMNATHIRFPVEKGAELQAFSNLANAKIRVIEVNRDTK